MATTTGKISGGIGDSLIGTIMVIGLSLEEGGIFLIK